MTNQNETNKQSASFGGCPVKHSSTSSSSPFPTNNNSTNATSRSSWTSWFRSPTPAASTSDSSPPVDSLHNKVSGGGGGGGCPVKHSASSSMSSSSSSSSSAPSSIEEAARHAQTPQPDQIIPLSTFRTVSSIQRTEHTTSTNPNPKMPHHQSPSENNQKWVYPSEQQFYNAMRRKGWQLPPGTEATIPHVVQIHNAVNEKGWKDIIEWEKMRGNDTPRLVRFMGRPEDLSPKAFLTKWVWMKKGPFDRHDWFVDEGEGGGEGRRYVIDFYGGADENTNGVGVETGLMSRLFSTSGGASTATTTTLPPKPPSMYIDVRPALDNTEAFYDHAAMFMKKAFPGIYEAVSTSSSASGAGATAAVTGLQRNGGSTTTSTSPSFSASSSGGK